MNRIARTTATVLVWLCAAIGVFFFCVRPWQCNVVEKRVEARTDAIDGERITALTRLVASRENLSQLRKCCPTGRCGVSMLMLLAANYRFRNDPRLAIDLYTTALRYDRRPELYQHLGEAQIEAGDYDAGRRNLILAALYQPELANDVPAYHDEVMHEVSLYQLKIAALRAAKGLK